MKARTLAAHVGVSMLGKMLSTTFLPASESDVTSERSRPTRENPGAEEPTAGSSPLVLKGVSRSVT